MPVTQNIIIVTGVSGVGKSYYCDRWIESHPEYVCVPAYQDIDFTISEIIKNEFVIMDYYLVHDFNANALRAAVECPVEIIVLFERPEIISHRQINTKAESIYNNVSCWASKEFYTKLIDELIDAESCKCLDGDFKEYSRAEFIEKIAEYWIPYTEEEIRKHIEYMASLPGYDWEYHHFDLPYGIRIGKDGYARNEETWEIIKDWIDWDKKDVLDLCCFHGYFSQQIAKSGGFPVACDINKDALYSAAILAKINDVKIKIRSCNVNNEIPHGEYDVALLLNVFHHITNKRELLIRMRSFAVCLFEINKADRFIIEEYFTVTRETQSPKDGRIILMCNPIEIKSDKGSEKISSSFSSANMKLPEKLIRHNEAVVNNAIVPLHIQWMPTNRCDQNCSFCSCADRDSKQEMDIARARAAIEVFAGLGTKAVTITGGGEPTLYKHFSALIETFKKNNIEIGIVTNGLQYAKWDYSAMSAARWIRMSISDEYANLQQPELFDTQIAHIIDRLSSVDFALSYVVTDNSNPDFMCHALAVANKYSLTHIRFVLDIQHPNQAVDFDTIFKSMDTSRAIIQPRTDFECGASDCLIALAKPVIAADSNIYPCCGVQYAKSGGTKDMTEAYRMGAVEDAANIWAHQWAFDGTRCDKCFYGGYNSTLSILTENATARHRNFI